jgi:hypothetical protein
MNVWTETVVALACSYAAALAMWPIMSRFPQRWIRVLSLMALPLVPYVGLTVGPDPVSPEAQRARLVIAVFSGAMAVLCFLNWQRARRHTFGSYARFLLVGMVNPHPILPVKVVSPKSEQTWPEIVRIIACVAVIGVTCLVATALLNLGMKHYWLLNYLIVVAAFIVIAEAAGQAVLALGRMIGYRGKPIVDKIWLARTPAEFLRRWNWPAHALFYHYVFVPCGGRNRLISATLMVFLVSGLGHELLAGAGLGRVTGHQTAFFLLSGLGVIASPQIERLAQWGVQGEIVMRLTTIVFMLATATLMFATLNYFVPMFNAPAWLAW